MKEYGRERVHVGHKWLPRPPELARARKSRMPACTLSLPHSFTYPLPTSAMVKRMDISFFPFDLCMASATVCLFLTWLIRFWYDSYRKHAKIFEGVKKNIFRMICMSKSKGKKEIYSPSYRDLYPFGGRVRSASIMHGAQRVVYIHCKPKRTDHERTMNYIHGL